MSAWQIFKQVHSVNKAESFAHAAVFWSSHWKFIVSIAQNINEYACASSMSLRHYCMECAHTIGCYYENMHVVFFLWHKFLLTSLFFLPVGVPLIALFQTMLQCLSAIELNIDYSSYDRLPQFPFAILNHQYNKLELVQSVFSVVFNQFYVVIEFCILYRVWQIKVKFPSIFYPKKKVRHLFCIRWYS